ncbi:MAG: YihY family inner membrane protein [Aquabacterium sp.]|nr:YihY family inner membrane protein [Aquabacterium sp.]
MIPVMTLKQLLADLSQFPWRDTAITLRNRFREDHMGLTASSLTFTTSIALVPFFTVALAIFTAFPMFAKLQGSLQVWLIESLIPDNISRQVLGYLTQFSRQASKLGVAGLAVLVVTAVAMILTIDRTFNSIWRVRHPRPFAQRVLIYWAAVTLGPAFLGASLAATSYLLPFARNGMVGPSELLQLLLDSLEFVALAGGMAALYHYMPNTYVKWAHAWTGGVFVAVGIAMAKKILAVYLSMVPSYSVVYGAFATLPILLVWIYVAWIIVLMGAVIAAYLPSLLAGVARRASAHGWRFQLALELLQLLDKSRSSMPRGQLATNMAQSLRVDLLELEQSLEALCSLHWIGQLADAEGDNEARYVLLVDPDRTPIEPLVDELLLDKTDATRKLWSRAGWAETRLREVL